MNGYSKFRENNDNHTIETSSKTQEECQEKDSNSNSNHNLDNFIPPTDPNMKTENFVFRRNHSTTSQRFGQSNSDLKSMMRRAFSTKKAYWRLEDDVGNGVVGNGDFVQEHDLDKNYEARESNNIEGKKKKKSLKRWKKIFHF